MTVKFKKRYLCIAAGLIMAIITGATGVYAYSGIIGKKNRTPSLLEKIVEEKGFIYGVNAPWVEANDQSGFGGRTIKELAGGSRVRENNNVADAYRRIFVNCKAIGYDAVKIWLFSELDGIKVSETGDILGFDEYFMNDFKAVMNEAKAVGIAVDLTLVPHMDNIYSYTDGNGTEIYYKLTQFIVNPECRRHYLNRIVKPLCEEINKNYRDVVLSVTAYCEPEGDTYGEGAEVSGSYIYGTSWDTLCDFINDLTECVKSNLPNIPVATTSGWNPYKPYRYNTLKTDIIGVDVYNNSGSVPDPEELNVNKPIMLTEFGQDTANGYNHSDDFHIANTLAFYDNAKDAGYLGAFYWHFNGYAPLSVTYKHRTYSALRPIASVMHYRIIDEERERKGIADGIVADAPALLYGDDALTLQWIASRDAKSYEIETSYDYGKTWNRFALIDDADSITGSANICSYDISTTKQGIDVSFRVSVKTYDDLKASSEPITFFMPKLICSDEENLLKNGGFESGSLENWEAADCIKLIEKNESGDTHRGNYCMALPGDKENHLWHSIWQDASLKANTTYRITFYSKHLWDTYTKNFKLVLMNGKTEVKNYLEENIAVGNDFTLNTYTFTTGDNPENVRVVFVNNYEQIFIDSVCLFETD